MKVPRLRFKDDDGREFPEWGKKTIEELINSKIILKPLDGNHGELHPKSSDYVDVGIPFVMANDIRNNVVDIEGTKKISKAQADGLQKGFSFEGDVLLTHKGSVGFVAIVPKLSVDYIMLTPQVTYYRVVNKQKLSNKFLANYFTSPSFQKEFLLLSGGGTRAYLGITEQRNLKIYIPCILEQTKIANFLTAIDEKITQLTQKCNLLAQYKKGVMQQIFSQKLRFKDDDGREFPEWEEKKLGEIGSFFSGGTPTSTNKEFYNGDIPFIKSGEINATSTTQFITEDGLKKSSAKKVNVGDLLYALYGATSGTVAISKIEGAINQAVLCIRSSLNNYFLYSYLHHMKKSILETYLQGGQGNLSAEIIKSLIVPYPIYQEQTKIANFLTTIDDKITQAQAQLDAVKRYKKGLLQQLFV